MNTERVIISGFGGQGALTIGQVIAIINLNKGKNVTWMPSYGAEMRGGTANCSVIASDEVIGSPLITKNADVLIAMNNPSVDKFLPLVAPGGTVILNTSIVSKEVERTDVNVIKIDATNISVELSSPKVQNMVILGGYLKLHNEFNDDDLRQALIQKFGAKGEKLLDLNMAAAQRGREV